MLSNVCMYVMVGMYVWMERNVNVNVNVNVNGNGNVNVNVMYVCM